MTTLGIRVLTLCAAGAAAASLAACAGKDTAPPVSTPAPPATTTAAAATARLSTIDGTAFYASYEGGGAAVQVWSSRNGTATKHHRIPVPKDDPCVANSVIVSPDGRSLAWVTSNGQPVDIFGTLTVSDLDGKNPRSLDNVVCRFNELSWTADSRKLAVTQHVNGDARQLYVDARTGATEARTASEAVWSANRAFRVRPESEGSRVFVVESASGAVVHTVRDYTNDYGGFDTCGYTLKGVSDDGRYVTIGGCATDPSRILGAKYLYDTVAGRHVTLPVTRADAVVLLGGDTVLVRGPVSDAARSSLVLMSTAGMVVTKVAEPAALPTSAAFLGYAPGR